MFQWVEYDWVIHRFVQYFMTFMAVLFCLFLFPSLVS